MANIDDRVVQMKFDNKQFEQGVSTSMSSLEKLKSSLQFKGTSKGLEEVQKATNSYSTKNAVDQNNQFSKSFIALTTIGVTALSRVTNTVIDYATRAAGALTLDPIKQGFNEYELKMKSIQTILANTARYGTTLDDVTAALDKLNAYSDQTIYNFAEMTKNASLFTNAGMKIEDATAVIKGFSNEAAASGTGAQEAAAAAYQLSQAFSAGTIRLMDWRSLTNVGMGNKNMQKGLIELGAAMGQFNSKTTTAQAATENFNASLESEWLSADVMMNYLKIQAGELTDEQMRGLGLTAKQITAFKKQAATALDAATKIRTATQFWNTLKESIGSGWSETFTLLIGDFEEATTLFGQIGGAINPIIQKMSDSRNALIKEWIKLGGRTDLFNGLKNIFATLSSIISAVARGFRTIFPKKTAEELAQYTKRFLEFTTAIRKAVGDARGLQIVVATFFNVIKTGAQFVFQLGYIIMRAFAPLLPIIKDLGATVANLIDRFNDAYDPLGKLWSGMQGFAVALDAFLQPLVKYLGLVLQLINLLLQGDMGAVKAFLGYIGEQLDADLESLKENLGKLGPILASGLSKAANFLRNLGGPVFDRLASLIDGIVEKLGGVKDAFQSFELSDDLSLGWFNNVKDGFQGVKKEAEGTKKVWEYVVKFFSKIAQVIAGALAAIGTMIGALFNSFNEWLADAEFEDIVELVKTIILGGILLEIKKFMDNVNDIAGSVSKTFDTLTDTLKNMQRNVQANIILKIAIAVGLLAASILTLGLMDPVQLAQGIGAVVGVLAALVVTMQAMNKIGFKKGQGVIGAATALTIMSVAVLILAQAVKSLGATPTDVLVKGGIALAALLTMVTGFMTAMNKFDAKLGILTATALNIMAVAIAGIAATAVLLGMVDPGQMARGLGVILALIGEMTLMAASLAVAGPLALLGAAALAIMTGALVVLSGLAVVLGAMPAEALGKGLLVLLLLIGEMTVALTALGAAGPMALVGAVAIMATAKALAIMTAALVALALLSNGDIFKGLATLLALTGVIALLGATATAFALPLLGLAAAVFIFGAAILAAGAGIWLFAAGITALSIAFGAGIPILKTGIQEMLTLSADLGKALAEAILSFATTLVEMSGQLLEAIGGLIGIILQAIIDNTPKLKDAFIVLIRAGLETIRTLFPEVLDVAWDMLIAFLTKIKDNLSEVIDLGGDIIVAFIKGIGKNLYKIVTAAGDTVLKFLNGLTKYIEDHDDEFIDAGYDLIEAILTGMAKGLAEGPKRLAEGVRNLGNSVVDGLKGIFGINSPSKVAQEIGGYVVDGLAIGLNDAAPANKAAEDLGREVTSTMSTTISKLQDAINLETDLSPTITPVIDISQYRKDAQSLSNLLPEAKFAASVSYSAANDLAQQAAPVATAQPIVEEKHIHFEYQQNNHSPEPLSTAEIYRQTRNQMAMVKRNLETVP